MLGKGFIATALITGGCVVGILGWTGAQHIQDAKDHIVTLEGKVIEYDGNENTLIDALETMKGQYVTDVTKLKDLINQANVQIETANKDAESLGVAVQVSKDKMDKYTPEDISEVVKLPDCSDCGLTPKPECNVDPVKDRTKPIPMVNFESGKATFRMDNSYSQDYTLFYKFKGESEYKSIVVPVGADNCDEHRVIVQKEDGPGNNVHLDSYAVFADGTRVNNQQVSVGVVK